MNEYRDRFQEIERNATWSLPRVVLLMILAIVAIYAVGFAVTGGDLAIYRFWAPKYADAQRSVFENTQSYVQGKVEYLAKLRYQYQEADGEHRAALRMLIISEASTVDNDKLPADLRAFVRSVK